MRYKKKPKYIEALTFDELVEYGKAHAESENNGVPWSFKYNGCSITHENDDCYLIGKQCIDLIMTRENMLVLNGPFDLQVMDLEMFNSMFDLEKNYEEI